MLALGRQVSRLTALSCNLICPLIADAFVKILIHHHHRRRATAGEAFDELDAKLSLLRRLQGVRLGIKAESLAKMLVQFVRAAERTTQSAADLELVFPRRLLAKHRIEGDQLVNVD